MINVTCCESWTALVGSELIVWIAFETRQRKLVKAGSEVQALAWRSPITSFVDCLEPSLSLEGSSAITGNSIASDSIASNSTDSGSVTSDSLASVAFSMTYSAESTVGSITWSN